MTDELPPSMDRFGRELERAIARELGPDTPTPARPTRRARLRVLAGTVLSIAGAGIALALLLSATSSTAAFAVTKNHDGSVTVSIHQLAAGVQGANQKLAALGIRVRAVPVAAACAQSMLGDRMILRPSTTATQLRVAAGLTQARIDPTRIPAGKALVLAAWRDGRVVHVAPARLVRGATPVCLASELARQAALVHSASTAASVFVHCKKIAAPAPGNSGNSANSGNSGNSGSSGNSGNSGSSGNSGNSGNSGDGTTTSVAGGPAQVAIPLTVFCAGPQRIKPPAGSGNSGNSGNS